MIGGSTSPTRISVVVTCYNLERYIGEAIGSVLDQDYAGEVEIIVVDDCSTDDSARIIAEFDGVRLVTTERNSGVMLAMLAGVEAASGDLICFLDGDDVWESAKLAAVRRCFDEDDAVALITHDLIYIDSDGLPLDRRSRPAARIGAAEPKQRGVLVRKGILEFDDYVWLGSALCIRRSLADWDRFATWVRALPDPRNTYQDWPLAYWVAAIEGAETAYIDQPLFRYRLHGANHSGDSRTAEKALRNMVRSLNTARAMTDVASRRSLALPLQRNLADRSAFYEYLVALHGGQRAAANRGFARSVPYILRRGLLPKEMARFAAVQLLGQTRFARLAARRSFLRNLQAS